MSGMTDTWPSSMLSDIGIRLSNQVTGSRPHLLMAYEALVLHLKIDKLLYKWSKLKNI
jgi:hypothetical protein